MYTYFKKKEIVSLIVISVLLFLSFVPLVTNINFMQNDDWVYYEMVPRFMQGDFRLHEYTGPTFYTQGILAAEFAHIFGLDNVPFLTLLISVINFVLLTLILRKFVLKDFWISVILGLIYFFSPIAVYLSLGFMTEAYYMPFFLGAIFSFLMYRQNNSVKWLIMTYITVFIGIHVRQVGLTIPLSIVLLYLVEYIKNQTDKTLLKKALLHLVLFVGFFAYYRFVMPLSPRILEVGLAFDKFFDITYVYALMFASFATVTAFILPVVIPPIIAHKEFLKNKVLYIVAGVLIYFLLNTLFMDNAYFSETFYYIQNTVTRAGFYPHGIEGEKNIFIFGTHALHQNWALAAKVIFSFFSLYMLLKVLDKKLEMLDNFFLINIVIYAAMLVITHSMYDRYLVVLIPLVILYVGSISKQEWFSIQNRLYTGVLVCWLVFLMVYSYQYSLDFITTNNYVWSRSEQIVKELGIQPNRIKGNRAWTLNHGQPICIEHYIYLFSRDNPKQKEVYATQYEIVETYSPSFSFSIWKPHTIYLYKNLFVVEECEVSIIVPSAS